MTQRKFPSIVIPAIVLTIFLAVMAQAQYVAPPAPKFTDAERVTELKSRRSKVGERMTKESAMILFSGRSRIYAGDVDYPFRQENNLYYLTNIKQEGVSLILIPGATKVREILFVEPRNPAAETWTGRMISHDEARAISGIQEVWDIKMLPKFLAYLIPESTSLVESTFRIKKLEPASDSEVQTWNTEFQVFNDAVKNKTAKLNMLSGRGWGEREYKMEIDFVAGVAKTAPGIKFEPAGPIFAGLRLYKSQMEIALIQHAVDITREAFDRAYKGISPNMYENEAHAEFEYTFHRRHADSWGYPCIVGGGANATTLHYITNDEKLHDLSVLLMDCAAEYDHYTADITRTIPVNGKYTKEQADIYRIVYEAHIEAIKIAKPGALLNTRQDKNISATSVHGRAAEVIKEGLLKLGLITSKDNNEYRHWFMHGTSHWLGMNVHDVGDYSTPLAPGMVFTIEPGIYIRPDALEHIAKDPKNKAFVDAVRPAFEKYKGIGIRIEDDILITTDGNRNMSEAIPSKLEEIEAAMAKSATNAKKNSKAQKTVSTKF